MFSENMQAQPQRIEPDASSEKVGDRARADILASAALCFMERGYTETSIDDVARRLASTKGRIYHHFASKADLFAAVYRAGMDKDYEAIAEARRQDGSARQRLEQVMRAHTRQIIESRAFQRVVWQGVQLLMRGATTPQLREELMRLSAYRDDYEKIFREAMLAATQEMAVRVDNASLAVALMFVTLNSPMFWYAPRAGETADDIDKLVGQIVKFALRGLGFEDGRDG
jgi:AcrR family transcriptional regulator